MTGQEFLLLRGVMSEIGVTKVAEHFGRLGILEAALPLLWLDIPLLTRDASLSAHFEGEAAAEAIEDWLRIAALMDFAVGLVMIVQDPERLPEFRENVDATGGVEPSHWPVPITDFAETPWTVSILGGAARLGLSCSVKGSWLEVKSPTSAVDLSFEITVDGVHAALEKLLNVWLAEIHPTIDFDRGGQLVVAPNTLLHLLWFQLANAAVAHLPLRKCAWVNCPGPPERPGVFMWQYGASPSTIKHRDAQYCHPKCSKAAATAAYRKRNPKPAVKTSSRKGKK